MELCRTCMNVRGDEAVGDQFISIFSVVDDDVYIAECLTQWVGVTIEEDDGLPSEVCHPCVEAIKSIALFVENAKDCDRKLRNKLLPDITVVKTEISPLIEDEDYNVIEDEIKDEVEISLVQPTEHIEIEFINEESNEEEEQAQFPQSDCEEVSSDSDKSYSSEDQESSTVKRSVKKRTTKRTKSRKKKSSPKDEALLMEDNLDELDEKELETFDIVDVKDKIVCCGCYKWFETTEDLERHGESYHQPMKRKKFNACQSKPVVCKFCYRRFDRETLYKTHRKPFDSREKVYRCKLCNKRFVNPRLRRKHAHNHIEVSVPVPNYFTVSIEKLMKHGFMCCVRGCTVSRKTEDDLFEHIRDDHPKLKTDITADLTFKPIQCVFCFRYFESMEKLNGHQMHRYFGVNGSSHHQCSKCGKICQSNDHLTAHENKHTGNKPYKCDICFKDYFSNAVLKQHRLTHTLEKHLECKICGMTFRMKSFLENHYRIHSDEKPFQCNVCHKNFRHSSSLFSHKKIHDPDQYRKCPVCGKGFADGTNLKRHMVSHTGVKPYGCDYCDKRFMRLIERGEHMSVVHQGVMPYSCDICGVTFSNKRSYQKHEHTL
ncbi:zinc finger protein 436-like [Sabethes cyaneus]|uniref:zinc finger protein 436-like n=1 Tax=Sabethes cyaneus TaxID=53552 RepID=UPI00237D8D29|nr:zinc finger protein 436-like [Sabethes cyaneus]